MALTQKGDNINWSLIFERPKNRRREGRPRKGEKKRKRKRKRREEEEEEEKKKRREGKEDQRYGTCIYLYRYMFVGCGL